MMGWCAFAFALRRGAADIRAVSPLTYAQPQFPPTLLLHGLRDEMVPPGASQQFHDALQACGATSELHFFAGQIHEFDAAASLCALTQDAAAVFVDRLSSTRPGSRQNRPPTTRSGRNPTPERTPRTPRGGLHAVMRGPTSSVAPIQQK